MIFPFRYRYQKNKSIHIVPSLVWKFRVQVIVENGESIAFYDSHVCRLLEQVPCIRADNLEVVIMRWIRISYRDYPNLPLERELQPYYRLEDYCSELSKSTKETDL